MKNTLIIILLKCGTESNLNFYFSLFNLYFLIFTLYSHLAIAKKFIRYWITASNRKGHGMHSPFVFDFIVNVLNDKKEKTAYSSIEEIRNNLLKNKTYIEVEDFGAGSTVIKNNKRRIDKIAASSLKPKKYAQLLHRMVACYQPNTIVELGTSFGITTSYLASGNPAANIHTFEGASNIAAVAQNNFHSLQFKNIELHQGDFAQTLPIFFTQNKRVDFAFIDGNHKKKPTLDYFKLLLQNAHEDTMLIFDDIHWSAEMEGAWEEIKAHPRVTLSIDLFFIGIVIFKKEFKAVQHYCIQF